MERLTGRKLPQNLLNHFLNLLMFSYRNDFKETTLSEFYTKMAMEVKLETSNQIFHLVQSRFSSFFKGLSTRQRNILSSHFECRIFLPNEPIILRTQSSPGIFFIVSGEAILVIDKETVQWPIITLKKGSYFGEDFLVGKNQF